MTTHARALDLAACTPAFRLDPAEDGELHGHLRACAECAHRVARLRADAAAIGRIDPPLSPRLHDRIREVAVTAPRSGPSLLGLVVILSLLAVGVVGASIGAGAFLAAKANATPTAPETIARAGDAIHWQTGTVELAAKEAWLDVDGRRISIPAAANLREEPVDAARWSLITWWGVSPSEQRLDLKFQSDGSRWWVSGLFYHDESRQIAASTDEEILAPAAIGSTVAGDVNVVIDGTSGPVTLHLGDLRIAVRPDDHITAPFGGGIVLQELPDDAGNPARPGGVLYCTGILQLPPKAAEARLLSLGYRLSWRWQYSTGGNTGYAEIRDRAPDTGWITDAAVGSSGELIVFVADPARPFGGPPRGLPADCPTPAP
jgi:hypothetical protein